MCEVLLCGLFPQKQLKFSRNHICTYHDTIPRGVSYRNHNHKRSSVRPTDLRFPCLVNNFVMVKPVAHVISVKGACFQLPYFVCLSGCRVTNSLWIWRTDGSLPKEQFIKLGWWSWSGISSTKWSSVFYETKRDRNLKYSEQILWWKKKFKCKRYAVVVCFDNLENV